MSDPTPAAVPEVAAVLAGGLGTRLRPAVGERAKAVVEIGGRPFVACVLDRLAALGVGTAVLCTGYRAGEVRRALGDRHGALRLEHCAEPEPLGTGGALRLAMSAREWTGPLLVVNGDTFCTADLAAFARAHRRDGTPATLLLAHRDDAARYGRVAIDDRGRVVRFEEKGGAGPGWVSAGVYLLSRAVVESIPDGRAVSLEREVFPAWVGRGLAGWPGDGDFIDIGTPAALARAESFLDAHRGAGSVTR